MTVITMITIKLDTEREVAMSVSDAKRIYAELGELFGQNKSIPLTDSEPDWVEILRQGYKRPFQVWPAECGSDSITVTKGK